MNCALGAKGTSTSDLHGRSSDERSRSSSGQRKPRSIRCVLVTLCQYQLAPSLAFGVQAQQHPGRGEVADRLYGRRDERAHAPR
jgi:hypothetical protein